MPLVVPVSLAPGAPPLLCSELVPLALVAPAGTPSGCGSTLATRAEGDAWQAASNCSGVRLGGATPAPGAIPAPPELFEPDCASLSLGAKLPAPVMMVPSSAGGASCAVSALAPPALLPPALWGWVGVGPAV